MFLFTKTPEQLSEDLFLAIEKRASIDSIQKLLTPNEDGECASLQMVSTKRENKSPLMYAASIGYTEAVSCFLPHLTQADLDFKNTSNGKTALHEAAEAGHLESVKLLVNAKASVEIEDNSKYRPLTHACFHGKTDVVAFFLTLPVYTNPNEMAQNDKDFCVRLAAVRNLPDVIVILANAGIRIDHHPSAAKDTPLIVAIRHKNEMAALCLLSLGASVHAVNTHGDTALHWAASLCPALLPPILHRGGDPDLKNKENISPREMNNITSNRYLAEYDQANNRMFILAKQQDDNADAMEECFKKGAYFDLPDADGNTPIVHACRAGNTNIVKKLFDKGAKTTGNAASLLLIAIEHNHLELLHFLIAEKKLSLAVTYPQGSGIVSFGIRHNKVDALEFLVQQRLVDINNIDTDSIPVLLYIAQWGTPDMMKMILKYIFSLNITDKQGNTVLHYAARNTSNNLFPVLIGNNILTHFKIDSLNMENLTPLMCAALSGSAAATSGLIEAGANIDIRENGNGKDALTLALDGKHRDVVKILVYEYLKHTKSYELNSLIYILTTAGVTKNDMCEHVLHVATEAGQDSVEKQVNILLEATTQNDTLLYQYMQIPNPTQPGDPIALLTLELQRIYNSNAYKDLQLRRTSLHVTPNPTAPPLYSVPGTPEGKHAAYQLPVIYNPPVPNTSISAEIPAVSEEHAQLAAKVLLLYVYQERKRLENIENTVRGFFPNL